MNIEKKKVRIFCTLITDNSSAITYMNEQKQDIIYHKYNERTSSLTNQTPLSRRRRHQSSSN